MSWVEWSLVVIGAWTAVSVPVSMGLGRLLRSRAPLGADDLVPVIADEDRVPLPPALRAEAGVGR